MPFQLGARKRKFLSADESPIPKTESRQSSFENLVSPTPKRRRGSVIVEMPKKRTRSSFTEEIPADPDISFVGETQLSFGSSIPDSQFQDFDQVGLVGFTLNAGAKASGIFDAGEGAKEKEDILQDTDPEPELQVVSTPSRRRRSSRKLSMAQIPEKSRTAKGAEVDVDAKKRREAGPSTAKLVEIMADSMDIEVETEAEASCEVGESAREVVSGVRALDGLRRSFRVLEAARLTSGECRVAENIVFDAFAKLRKRGHGDKSSD